MRKVCLTAGLIILLWSAGLQPAWSYSYFWKIYDSASGAPGGGITSVSVDPGGYVWVGAEGSEDGRPAGIGVLDRMYEFITPYGVSDGLCSNRVSAVGFENVPERKLDDLDNGTIWFATNRGLSVLDRKGVFTSINAGNSPLPGNNISSIYINKTNTKWVSVWGKGVSCIDVDFNYSTHTTANGLCSNYILSIVEDRNGNIWFGSRGRGVSCLDREGNWIHLSSANSGLIGDHVRKIVEEAPNKLWFLTPGGISVFDGQNWMSYTARNSPLGNYTPTTMVIDRSGNKWIGTEGGGLFKLDSFGMWTRFHKGNTSLPADTIQALAADERGAVWIATPAGLCSLANFPQRPQAVLPGGEFQAPVSPGIGKGTYFPFAYGLAWENIGQTEQPPGLSFSLPTFFYGGRSWFYAALWGGQDFSLDDLQYSIVGNRMGGLRLRLDSFVARMEFFVRGGLLSSHADVSVDKKMPYPFPARFPEELGQFRLPGDHIPSSDPEIRKASLSLVRPQSRGDMYRTMRDIVYSKLIQQLALDERHIGLLAEKERGEENARVNSVKDVYYVLKHRKGDRHSKARLICTLARAAGVPARIVAGMSGNVWCQAWLAGLGWVSIEAAYPAYDYVRPLRTYMPKIYGPGEQAVAAVSGKNDDVGRVLWDSRVKAYYVENRPEELSGYQSLRRAKILLTKIVSEGQVPDNAKMQMDRNIFVFARQAQDRVLIVFQDGTGRELKAVPLVFEGLSLAVNVNNRFFWKFIPRRIGDIIVLENLLCKSE